MRTHWLLHNYCRLCLLSCSLPVVQDGASKRQRGGYGPLSALCADSRRAPEHEQRVEPQLRVPGAYVLVQLLGAHQRNSSSRLQLKAQLLQRLQRRQPASSSSSISYTARLLLRQVADWILMLLTSPQQKHWGQRSHHNKVCARCAGTSQRSGDAPPSLHTYRCQPHGAPASPAAVRAPAARCSPAVQARTVPRS